MKRLTVLVVPAVLVAGLILAGLSKTTLLLLTPMPRILILLSYKCDSIEEPKSCPIGHQVG